MGGRYIISREYDISFPISFLSLRDDYRTEDDWMELNRLLNY